MIQRLAVKRMNYTMAALLALAVVGCERLERDVATAPDDAAVGRYGLEEVKLGGQRAVVVPQLQAWLQQPLQCKTGQTGLGQQRKAFVLEECQAVAKDGVTGKLWGEKLTALQATFVENQLVKLSLQLQTAGDYQALYEAHGSKVLSALGKPDEATAKQVRWQREHDEAVFKDLGGGKVGLDIYNKTVMQGLHHKN